MLVELALILPIIFVISLTVFEFTRAIHHLTIASSASKEFANIIKRECPDDPQLLPSCLDSELIQFQEYLQTIVTGTKLAVTYLKPTGDPIAPGDRATWNTPFHKGNISQSRLNLLLDVNKIRPEFSNLDRHEAIVFAECFVPFSPILVFINSIFTLPYVQGSFLYDATII